MIRSRYFIIFIVITQILFGFGLMYLIIHGFNNYKVVNPESTSFKGFLFDYIGLTWFIWPITLILSFIGLIIRRAIGWLFTSHLFFVVGASTIILGLKEFIIGSINDRFQIALFILITVSAILILNLANVLKYYRVSVKYRFWINIVAVISALLLVLAYSKIGLWKNL